MHIVGKVAYCIFYLGAISTSSFFIKETIFHGDDFYAHSMLMSDDFLKTQKHKHIYWKGLDQSLNWQDKKLEDYSYENQSRILNFDQHQKEKEIYQFIQDHTFKLSGPCNTGTGWILDFEIPESPKKYPTTWYIATNMHVINKYKFLDNPYDVVLPLRKNTKYSDFYVPDKDSDGKCEKSFNNGIEIDLEKTTIKVGDLIVLETNNRVVTPKINPSPNKKETVKPKLFYHALNFLGTREYKNNLIVKDWNNNYYKDFAVLEVTFDSEEKAKGITDDFYTNYYTNKSNTNRPINVFAPELMSRVKTPEELWNLEKTDYFYTAGYPGGFETSFVYNFAKNKKTSQIVKSKLDIHNETTYKYDDKPNAKDVFRFIQNKNKEPIIGHVIREKGSESVSWDNHYKKLESWGYLYAIKHLYLFSGASGSMVIDRNKNLLGVATAGTNIKNVGFVEPLSSEGIIDTDRKIISPKYDLIRGVPGQPMSYKSQLEKYHPSMNTYLKSINWKGPTNTAPSLINQ